MTAVLATAGGRIAPSRNASYVLVLTVFVTAWLEIQLFDRHVALATVYFGPGVLLATLYSLDGAARGRMFAAMGLAQAAGCLAAGLSPGAAVLSAAVMPGQAWVGAIVLRKLAPGGLDFTRAHTFGSLALVALLVSPPTGFAIRTLLIHADPALFGPGLAGKLGNLLRTGMLVGWLLPHAMGIVLAAPLTIGFCAWSRAGPINWWTGERVLILAANAVVASAVFFSSGNSYLFLIYPPMVWAGLRLGICDTAAAVLITLVIASVAAAHGYGPLEMWQTGPEQSTMFLDLAFLCACTCIMPIAASLEFRRRLEVDLALSLEFTGQILSNMHEIVFRTDAQGRWTFLNPAWAKITGYSVAETLGCKSTGLLVSADKVKPSAYSGLISGEVDELKIEQRIRRHDGEIRDIATSIRALRDTEGRFLGSTGTIRDISEHRRYVEGLEISERRFRQLCDAAPIGIVRCDRLGTITYLNKKLERILQACFLSLIGRPWLQVLGLDNPDLARQMVDIMGIPGAVFDHELNFRDGAGLRRWLIFSATGTFDQDSQLTGYIAAVNDITPRKLAESELAGRTNELRLLAENINDMIFRIGLDGACRYATPSVREVLGYDPQLLVGKPMTQVHPEDQQSTDDAFTELARGEVEHCTVAFRTLPVFPNAEHIWLEANCRLLRDKTGVPYEVMAAVRDITERKRLEASFIDACQRAELATLAKSAFVANLSHEIRTPLNGVIGLTELLLGRDLDEPSRRYAKLILESGAGMMQLLNDILDISKIDSGHLQLTDEAFDLHQCLANSMSLMTASAGGKHLELRLDIAPDLPRMIRGDSLRLRQVLANLIGNSVKFTEFGHVVVEAGRNGAFLEVRIEDTGIGIPEAQTAMVFEEFVQANPEVASGYGGTGLGLSISRRISEAMGGTLTLTSQVGKGTTLLLRIPANFIAEQAKVAPAPGKPALTKPDKPLHVLVAEDNHTNQIIINGMLQRLGHSSVLARTGAEAIAMVELAVAGGTPFDLVLMDIQMPEMDGIEATVCLRRMGFDAVGLPIIAVTANGYREDIAVCLAAGMQDHLTKPMRIADLKAALQGFEQVEGTTGALVSSPHSQPRRG